MDGLLKLLPVSRELLDAGFTLQVPQADGGVVTCGERQGSLIQQRSAGATMVTLAPLTARHEVQPVRIHS